MIKVENLVKSFGLNKQQLKEKKIKKGKLKAVDDVSFIANEGEIFALLGPNGAGKTTVLRCLAALINPDEGNIFLNDIDRIKNPELARKDLCFLTNELKLDDFFSADYLVNYFGSLRGLSEAEINKNKEVLYKEFGVDKFKDVKVGKMSSGMKQKTAIVVNLIHDPNIIIFDEPTTGLDVVTARSVTDYLIKLKNQGKTIIISTHIMTIAEKISDKIAIIIKGKIVANGTLKEILEKTNTNDLDDAFFALYKAVGGDNE